jgi:hypothetical protein
MREAIIDFLNESYDKMIQKNNYSIGDLEVIRKYLDDLIDSINNKEV